MSLEEIQIRNTRVEADKAWETSWTRRVAIALATYIVIGVYLTSLKVIGAWLHALVPAMGYLLSTLSLPFLKQYWLEKIYKKEASS